MNGKEAISDKMVDMLRAAFDAGVAYGRFQHDLNDRVRDAQIEDIKAVLAPYVAQTSCDAAWDPVALVQVVVQRLRREAQELAGERTAADLMVARLKAEVKCLREQNPLERHSLVAFLEGFKTAAAKKAG